MKTISGLRKALRKKQRVIKKKKHHKESSSIPSEPQSHEMIASRDSNSSKHIAGGDRQKAKRPKFMQGAHAMVSATNAEIEAEDREIERLSQLLGYAQDKKDRKRVAAKLNKEYSMFEGVGDDFGDFLMDLDDLADIALGKKDIKRKSVFASENGAHSDDQHDDIPEESVAMRGHVIDDDEQEESDIGSDIDEDDDDDEDEDEDDTGNEIEENEGNEEESKETGGSEEDLSDGSSDDGREEEEKGKDSAAQALKTYRPTDGEDIYGRKTADHSVLVTTKYVAPAKRSNHQVVDESSDAVKMVRRQMNGLLNRLSDQSKDSILRSMKDIFASNSVTIVSHVLRDCIMAACANPTQLMTTLIPVYASLVAALHIVVGVDVGAFVVESLTNSLFTSMDKARGNVSSIGVAALISDKMPNNCLLLLVYFYNLRVLHHHLIMDIMRRLADDVVQNRMVELCAELLVCIVDHCGIQLRSDDPVVLREVVTSLSSKNAGELAREGGEGTRIEFLMETLTDLKNNKSKRNQSANGEAVKKLRRWLGSVKSVFPCKHGDTCLNVSLNDLLDAEKRGRWWRAGASWLGNKDATAHSNELEETSREQQRARSDNCLDVGEEQKLLAIASKMRFNTDVRKKIFVVIMSSRDVSDAFERVGKLDLKGKQDREVMRVIVECCGQERAYNAFYAELASLLCSQNRQYKATVQFYFWDAFKDLSEGIFTDRRTMNLAQFLAHMVCTFHLPLSVIKPIDFTQLSDALVLFLATFFLAIFSKKISDETFSSVFDRVATTSDFAAVRDLVLSFLQTHFLAVPQSLDADLRRGVEKRRKRAIKSLEGMDVLNFTS